MNSNPPRVLAQNDTLHPKLKLNKTEIDLCNTNPNEKQFVLTVDLNLNTPLTQADSLYVIEIQIAFKKEDILFTGPLTLGTLFSQFNPNYVFSNIYENPGDYNILKIEGVSITSCLIGNNPAVHITGTYLKDDINCMPFILIDIYLGTEFQRNYKKTFTDTTTLCAQPRNLNSRYIEAKLLNPPSQDTIILDTGQSLCLDFGINVTHNKNLFDFNVLFNIDDHQCETLKIYPQLISPIPNCQYINTLTTSPIKYHIQIQNTNSINCFNGEIPILQIELLNTNSLNNDQIYTLH